MKRGLLICFFCLFVLFELRAQIESGMTVEITLNGGVDDIVNDAYINDLDCSNVNYKIWLKKDPSLVLTRPDDPQNHVLYYVPEEIAFFLEINLGSFPKATSSGDIVVVEVSITRSSGEVITARNEMHVSNNTVNGNYFSSDNLWTPDEVDGPGVDLVWNKVDDGDTPGPDPTKPEITVSGPLVACAGESVDLNDAVTADAGITLKFCSDAAGNTALANPAAITVSGTYYVYGEKDGVKSDIKAITVTINPVPTITLDSDFPVCKGDPFSVNASSNVTGTTYQWASTSALDINAGTTTGAVFNSAGIAYSDASITYTVKGTAATCTSAEKKVTVTIKPKPNVSLAVTDNKTAVCAGEEIELVASTTTVGTEVKYRWIVPGKGETISSTQTVKPTVETDYEVKSIVDGCESANSAKQKVTIKPAPTVTITGPASICKGKALTLTPNGADSYVWDAGTADANGVMTITPDNAGVFTYNVTGKRNGCEGKATHSLTVNDVPTPLVTVNGGSSENAEVCSGIVVNLVASGGTTYAWTGNVSGSGASKSETPPAGSVKRSYTVTVGNGNCTADKQVDVTILPLPEVTITGDQKACVGSEVTLTASANGIADGNFVWTGSINQTGANQSINPLATGDNKVTVTATDAKGCAGKKDYTVVGVEITPTLISNPLSPVNPGTTVTLSAGNTQSTGNVTYEFKKLTPLPEETLTGSGNTRSVTPTETSTYKVIATTTDGLGCQGDVEYTLAVKDVPLEIKTLEGASMCAGTTELTGKSLTAEAAGGTKPYKYEWLNLPTGLTLSQTTFTNASGIISANLTAIGSLGAGVHNVTLKVTDATGKVEEKTVGLVTILATPDVAINTLKNGTSTICQDDALTLTATAAGVTDFTWTSSATITNPKASALTIATATPTDAAGVTYTVTAKLNSCESSTTHIVIINEKPTVVISGSEGITDACVGEDIDLTAIASKGDNSSYQYTWSNGKTGTDIKYQVASAGDNVCSVEVKDGKGCKATSTDRHIKGHSVTITMPATSSVAHGQSVTLTPILAFNPITDGATSYEWTPKALIDGDNEKLSVNTIGLTDAKNELTFVVNTTYCREEGKVTINVTGGPLAVTPTADDVCLGTDVTLHANASGGSEDYSYQWICKTAGFSYSSALEEPTFKNVAVGIYDFEVEVTDKQTSKKVSNTVSVTVNALPEITSIVLTDPDKTEFCLNDEVKFTTTVPAGSNYSYAWSSGTTDQNPTIILSDEGVKKYTLTVTDNVTNCFSTQNSPEITVHSVKVETATAAPVTITSGGTVTLSGTASFLPKNLQGSVTYSWTNADLVDDPTALNTKSKALTSDQAFTLTITDGYGCFDSKTTATVVVTGSAMTIDPQLAASVGNICAGDVTITLNANVTNGSGTFSYDWTSETSGWTFASSDKDPVITTNLTEGEYAVKLKVTDLETNYSVDKILNFTVNALPKINTIVPTKVDVCKGDKVDINVTSSGAASYAWTGITPDPGSVESPKNVVVAEGENTYQLTVTSAKGCTATASTKVTGHSVTVLAGVKAGGSTTVIEGSVVNLEGTVTCVPIGEGGTLNYAWTPTNLIEPGEDVNKDATTIALNGVGKKKFTLTVTDAYCGATLDEVEIIVIEAGKVEVLANNVEICQSSVEQYVDLEATVVPGDKQVNYKWTPIASPSKPAQTVTSSNTAKTKVNIKGLAAGDYWFEIQVTDKNNASVTAKDTSILTVKAGPVITELAQSETCFPPVVHVTATGATSYDWEAITTSPTISFYEKNDSDTQTLDWDGNTGAGKVRIYVLAKGNGCQDSAAMDVNYIKLDLEASWLTQKDTCANLPVGIELAYTTAIAGQYTIEYEYTPVSGMAQSKTQDLTLAVASLPKGKVSFNINAAGTYKLTSIKSKDNAYKACASAITEANSTIQVGNKPKVTIDQTCLAMNPNANFTLAVDGPTATNSYSWQVSANNGGTWTSGATGDGTKANSINGVMADKDLRYIVTATENSALQCKAADTAIVYRIPDAPVLTISKDVGNVIKLNWPVVSNADSYSVWSCKWDPYCVDGGAYTLEQTTNNFDWSETNMDIEEFYYLTSNKNICGKLYHSYTSDTVGYLIQNAVYNSLVGGLSHISYPFDMSGVMGGNNASNLISNVIGDNTVQLSAFGFSDQLWNPCFYMFGSWMGDFMLEVGRSYLIDVTQNYSILMYGKLPAKIKYNFVSGTNGNLSPGFLPFHHAEVKETADIITNLGEKILVYYWNFNSQIFDATLIMFGTPMGSIPVKVGHPLLFEPNGVPSIKYE